MWITQAITLFNRQFGPNERTNMTYLEVHTPCHGTHRWPMGELPEGDGQAGYRTRMEFINASLAHYRATMSYAFKEAEIYIIHEAKFKPDESENIR